MEILLLVLGGWIVASVAAALLIGRALSVADRRERATVITGSSMPSGTHATVGSTAGAGSEAQESA